MTTELICCEIWPIWPENWRVMLRNGTVTAMENPRPEIDRLGTPSSMNTPPMSATMTYMRLPRFMRMGPRVLVYMFAARAARKSSSLRTSKSS